MSDIEDAEIKRLREEKEAKDFAVREEMARAAKQKELMIRVKQGWTIQSVRLVDPDRPEDGRAFMLDESEQQQVTALVHKLISERAK